MTGALATLTAGGAVPAPEGGARLDSSEMLNRGYAYTTRVRGEEAGQTLLLHLSRVYPHSSLEVWRGRLDSREVTVDGVDATGEEVLRAGQVLVWHRPPWREPEAPRGLEVLFEDAHLLAVNKPCGLPTLPGAGYMENTLLRLVQARTPAANPVHRLGRATTGIVLFAKTAQVARTLSADWNTPGVEKVYRALAQEVAGQEVYDIVTPIGLVPHLTLGMVWASDVGGKSSRSVAKVVGRSARTTTFEVALHSGRPHQIRVHLASIGHPLVGDPLYGFDGRPLAQSPGLPGDGGYFLHAYRLRFCHPVTGEQVDLVAELPAGFPG